MSDLELDEFDLGPSPSVHEILHTWFGTNDITEQTHQDCVCQIVRKARELERELAEAKDSLHVTQGMLLQSRESNKDISQIAAKMMTERDQWREVAQRFYDENEGNWPGYHSATMQAFRKLKEASK